MQHQQTCVVSRTISALANVKSSQFIQYRTTSIRKIKISLCLFVVCCFIVLCVCLCVSLFLCLWLSLLVSLLCWVQPLNCRMRLAPYFGKWRLPECAVFTLVSGSRSDEGPSDGSRGSPSTEKGCWQTKSSFCQQQKKVAGKGSVFELCQQTFVLCQLTVHA